MIRFIQLDIREKSGGRHDGALAAALERERKDTELIRQLVDALESVDNAMPFPVARRVLKVAHVRLEGKP